MSATARRLAVQNVVALIDVNLAVGEGDLWAGTDELSDAELGAFRITVEWIIAGVKRMSP